MTSLKNSTIFVLVTNASQAKLYKTFHLGQDLNLIAAYHHPESRKKGIDLITDRSGHYKSYGTAHGAFVEPTSPKEVAREQFAQYLAKELDTIQHQKPATSWLIIAPPHFYGLLKKYNKLHTQETIIHTIMKDYTQLPEKILLKHLADWNKPAWAA